MSLAPRPYQIEIDRCIEAGWEEASKQLVVAATGTGKTRVFCWLAARRAKQGIRTLILADQDELVWNPIEKLAELGVKAEAEKAEHNASLDALVVVGSVQTMMWERRLSRWPKDHFGLVIADEADKSLANSWQTVLRHFDGEANVCGFTATPNRSDKKNLGSYYERIAFESTLFDFIGNGSWAKDHDGNQCNWLSPIVVKMLPIAIDLNSVRSTSGDFDTNELHDAITPHLKEAAQAIREHASFRKVLAFVPLIATSQKFVGICNEIGLAAEHIDGTSEDREEKLKRFQAGEFDVLVNSQLLERGVDIPGIDCICDLSPTKSISKYMQRVGRGTRLAPFKDNLLLLDFLYDAQKKMVCRPAHLIAKDQDEAESITEISKGGMKPSDVAGEQLTAFDLMGMASIAQAQRERALRKKLEEQANKKAKFISAEAFALRNNSLSVAEYEPTMEWEAKPASEKQIKYLEKAGIDTSTVRGKGHASQLLGLYFHNKPVQMASPKQRAMLDRMRWRSADGMRGPSQATASDFVSAMAILQRRKKEKREVVL
jgi:superfamily II DNA or RNA helicase